MVRWSDESSLTRFLSTGMCVALVKLVSKWGKSLKVKVSGWSWSFSRKHEVNQGDPVINSTIMEDSVLICNGLILNGSGSRDRQVLSSKVRRNVYVCSLPGFMWSVHRPEDMGGKSPHMWLCWGHTVAEWSVLLNHSKMVRSLNHGWTECLSVQSLHVGDSKRKKKSGI